MGKEGELISRDIIGASMVSLVAPAIVWHMGDSLYIGSWYYWLLPLLVIAANYFCKSKAFMCSGMAAALQLSYLVFFYWQSHANEGLLSLIHLCFLLPFAVIGCTVALILAHKSKSLAGLEGFIYGFGGFAVGSVSGVAVYFAGVML